MYTLHLAYDDNLYEEPECKCKGYIDYESLEDALVHLKRIVKTQDYFIREGKCINPYTRIAIFENRYRLISVIYHYDKSIGGEYNRHFRKEIKGNDNLIHQIKE